MEQVSINTYLGAAREHSQQLIQNNELEVQLSECQKVREKRLGCIKEIAKMTSLEIYSQKYLNNILHDVHMIAINYGKNNKTD